MENYKLHRKLVTCTCNNCGKEFQKPESEFLRNQKLGRHNFCSRNCTGSFMTEAKRHNIEILKNSFDISTVCANRRDEYTPFRETFRRLRNRCKEVTITLEDLKQLWETQNGRCIYTNIPLELPTAKKHPDIRYMASLDRIDSTKGYIKGNIQFVATPINYMKSTMSDSMFKDYLKEILQNITTCVVS